MSASAKAVKLAALVFQPLFRSALWKHRVAAAVEHLDVIRFCQPATLLDIGANKGQFSLAVRALFPDVTIHAFEPLPAAADCYTGLFSMDNLVTLHRVAIGANVMSATFYVTDREDSSSLLKPGAGQKAAFGVSAAREIAVPVRPLDKVVNTSYLARPILMKIDVQGAELEVLRGIASLNVVDFIYVELSFVELYDGQPLIEDVSAYLTMHGFALRGVFNQAFTDKFGPTQADCLFVRTAKGAGV